MIYQLYHRTYRLQHKQEIVQATRTAHEKR